MKRAIKFRVWDKKYNRMFTPTDNLTVVWDKYEGSNLVCSVEDASGSKALSDDADEYVIMQYTGLRDKHGKDIYEGDIIKSHNSEGNPFLSLVVWKSESACFRGTSRYDENTFMRGYGERPPELFYLFEIIGNRFENPDLITVPATR